MRDDAQPAADFYPPWLEQWWVERACRFYRTAHFADCQAPLEKDIQRLSDLFTTDRGARFGDYARDKGLLLAYGLFYFPQTFARIRFPLREALGLRGWLPPREGPVRVLDLGAGLGGATLGSSLLLQDLFPSQTVEAMAVDQSRTSLQLLRQLVEENAKELPRVRLNTGPGDLKSWFRQAGREERWHIVLASFSLGEAFFGEGAEAMRNWVKVALSRLDEDGFLLIAEPALRETSERVERLRDLLAAEGMGYIWAPCPHHHRCPLLADGRFWCHEVRRWKTPESLAFLNRHLFRSVQELKFSFVMVGRRPAPVVSRETGSPHLMRLVSPISRMKGRYLWSGCTADGERHEFEIQKRDLSAQERNWLETIERGNVLQVLDSQQVGEKNRHRIPSAAKVRLWAQVDHQAASGDRPGAPRGAE